MSNTKELTTDLFKGFNSTDPDQLLAGLMRLFNTVNKALNTGEELKNVASILQTAKFVRASNPSLGHRMDVIIEACVNKLTHAYNEYSQANLWVHPILIAHMDSKKD